MSKENRRGQTGTVFFFFFSFGHSSNHHDQRKGESALFCGTRDRILSGLLVDLKARKRPTAQIRFVCCADDCSCGADVGSGSARGESIKANCRTANQRKFSGAKQTIAGVASNTHSERSMQRFAWLREDQCYQSAVQEEKTATASSISGLKCTKNSLLVYFSRVYSQALHA